MVRYNKVIELLEQDKPVFCSGLVWNGNLDDMTFVGDADYDMVIVEMEHQGFSFNDLRTMLQFLMNRKKVSEKGRCRRTQLPSCECRPTSGSVTNGSSSRHWTLGSMAWFCPTWTMWKTPRLRWLQHGTLRFPESPISSLRANGAGGTGSRRATGA